MKDTFPFVVKFENFSSYLPASPPLRRQYNDLWSEDESREQEAQDPIPECIIFPQLPLRGTIVFAIMIAIGALGSVGEVEPDDRQRVGERRQDPGQELNWRELGKIRSQLFW